MTTGEHPNVSPYRRTADAFRARDFDTVRSLVDADVAWHVPGRHSFAGDIRGLDELVAWLGRLSELGFALRGHDLFGNDEHVRALSYMGLRRPGVATEIRVTSAFYFRAGRQVERRLYPEDIAAWDAIFDGMTPRPR